MIYWEKEILKKIFYRCIEWLVGKKYWKLTVLSIEKNDFRAFFYLNLIYQAENHYFSLKFFMRALFNPLMIIQRNLNLKHDHIIFFKLIWTQINDENCLFASIPGSKSPFLKRGLHTRIRKKRFFSIFKNLLHRAKFFIKCHSKTIGLRLTFFNIERGILRITNL